MKGIITSHPLKGAFPTRIVVDLVTEEDEAILTETEQEISAVKGNASIRSGLHSAGISVELTSNSMTGVLISGEHITGRLENGR